MPCTPHGWLNHTLAPQIWADELLPAFLASTKDAKTAARLRGHFRRQRDQLSGLYQSLGQNETDALFRGLRRDGLQVHAIALDLTEVARRRQHSVRPTRPSRLLLDDDVKRALSLLVNLDAPLERTLLHCDQHLLRNKCAVRGGGGRQKAALLHSGARIDGARDGTRAGDMEEEGGAVLSASEARLLRRLREHGVLMQHDWGLNMTALGEQAAANLERAALAAQQRGTRGRLSPSSSQPLRHPHRSADDAGVPIAAQGHEYPLPALEPLLRNASLQRLISSYLGGPARFDGFNLIRYPPRFGVDFPAAEWRTRRSALRAPPYVLSPPPCTRRALVSLPIERALLAAPRRVPHCTFAHHLAQYSLA
jgi:hypothetical protein